MYRIKRRQYLLRDVGRFEVLKLAHYRKVLRHGGALVVPGASRAAVAVVPLPPLDEEEAEVVHVLVGHAQLPARALKWRKKENID